MIHRHWPSICVLFRLYQEGEPEVVHIHLGKKIEYYNLAKGLVKSYTLHHNILQKDLDHSDIPWITFVPYFENII